MNFTNRVKNDLLTPGLGPKWGLNDHNNPQVCSKTNVKSWRKVSEGILTERHHYFDFFFNFFHENVIKRHIWPPYLTQFPHYTRFYVPNFMFQYMVGSSNHKSTVVRLIKYHIQSLIMKISCYIPCLMILTPILPQNGLNHG